MSRNKFELDQKSNFAKNLKNLPSTLLAGLSTVVFGDGRRTNLNSKMEKSSFKDKFLSLGLVGSALYIATVAVSLVGQLLSAITNFIKKNKDDINIILWSAAAVAAGAAIAFGVMAIWFPEALAIATAFSIYEISIASLAGAEAAAQVGVAAGLAAAAVAATGTVVAGITAGVTKIVDFVKSKRAASSSRADDLDVLLSPDVERPSVNTGPRHHSSPIASTSVTNGVEFESQPARTFSND